MKQYKIKRNINGTLEVIGFEFHVDGDIFHLSRQVHPGKLSRNAGEFPMIDGDIKELAK